MTDPNRPTRSLVLAAVLAALSVSAGVSAAHDWVSPAASRVQPPSPEPAARWSHLLWDGPRSGPPPAPDAVDCDRAPQAIELDGPGHQARGRRDRRLEEKLGAAPSPAREADPAADALGKAAPAAAPPASMRSESRAAADSAPSTNAARLAARPAQEPVTAGVVDDNADFGAYLAFTRRHAGLPTRARDVSERYLLSVHDAAGQPVPDAEVSVFGAGALPALWARTDAGGRVWLHPRVAGLSEHVLEVQVHKTRGGTPLRGSALLKRGQRDQVQVRLDAALPVERARLDLVFMVDATGSMADEIGKLRSSMQAMADQIARLPSRPQICFGLVAYRDRGDAFFVRAFDFTSDLDAFQRVLGGLQAGGGGDYPEAMNEALHTAVHRLSWRGDGATRLVLMVADAPPHLDYGAPWYDEDMQGALARGIKLFSLGASGLDRVGELVFRQMAQFTGGRFVFLTYAEAHNPASGPGRETTHEVENYSVETLDKLVVRLVREELARRPA